MRLVPPLVTSHDKAMALRVRRLLMSVGSYVLWFALVAVAQRQGLVALSGASLALAFVTAMAVQALFYALIRSGFSQRFEDPSLTIEQILVAIAWVTLLIGLTQEIRGAMLNIYFVVILFGIFQLALAQFVLVSVAAAAGYAGVIAYDLLHQTPGFDLHLNIVQWFIMSCAFMWLSIIGNYMRALRQSLRDKKQALQESHESVLNQRDQLRRTHGELRAAMDTLRELAVRDDLTGLFNRRQLMNALQIQVAIAENEDTPLGVCVMDIDHFKAINDRYGHLAGDEILKAFADEAQHCIRNTDLIARYGGEEFVVLLPNATEEDARSCAERIRARFERVRFDRIDPELRVTLSAGATHHRPGEPMDAAVARADQALYRAKEDGRNRVVYATP